MTQRQQSAGAADTPDNWLAWLDNPSPADLEWIAQRDARDKQVGALLREGLSSHPWWSHKGPPETEEAYWSGLAANWPGLQADLILAERMRRKNESSTPEAFLLNSNA